MGLGDAQVQLRPHLHERLLGLLGLATHGVQRGYHLRQLRCIAGELAVSQRPAAVPLAQALSNVGQVRQVAVAATAILPPVRLLRFKQASRVLAEKVDADASVID